MCMLNVNISYILNKCYAFENDLIMMSFICNGVLNKMSLSVHICQWQTED